MRGAATPTGNHCSYALQCMQTVTVALQRILLAVVTHPGLPVAV